MRGQRFGPRLRQAYLAHRGGGLLFFQAEARLGPASRIPRQRDGAGGADEHLGALGACGGDVGRHAVQPGGARFGAFGVYDQGAA